MLSPGAVLDLAKLLPGQFKSGQVVCPMAQKVCPTLGCSGGCANGYCWQVQPPEALWVSHMLLQMVVLFGTECRVQHVHPFAKQHMLVMDSSAVLVSFGACAFVMCLLVSTSTTI